MERERGQIGSAHVDLILSVSRWTGLEGGGILLHYEKGKRAFAIYLSTVGWKKLLIEACENRSMIDIIRGSLAFWKL